MTRSGWGLVAVLVLAAVPHAATARQETFAVRGATVHTLAGDDIQNASVVIANGRITALGSNVTVPPGADVIDGSGLHVYPGLFNAFSQLGLQEINAVAVTNDVLELGEFNPHLLAATAVHPASERVAVTRANGVTHVVAAPSARSGGIGGQASAIHLDGWTVEEMLIEPAVGVVLRWPSVETRSFSFQTFSVTNRPYDEAKERYDEAVKQLRGWLESARRYERAAGSGNVSRDLRLEAMVPVVRGEHPVLVLAESERDIRSAIQFATDEGLRMILVGGRDAWKATDVLTEHGIPVLLRATQNLPAATDESYNQTFTTAAVLYEAGIKFAQTGWASAGPNPPSRTLAYEAANSVAFGLPWEEAIKSITIYPAEILGLGDQLGTVEVGKIANLIVTDGDPMEIRTQVLHVFIDGRPVSLANKHRELYERYRARD